MTCEICAGRGWVVIPDGGAGSARRCQCYTSRPIETRLREAGVGSDLLHSCWDTWKGARPDFSTFPNPNICVTILGPVGNGKSHAAVAVLREWIQRGHRCRFVEAPDLLEEIKAKFGTDEQPESVYRELQGYDLLVLDEAYAQQQTPWADATLSRIIRGRLRDFKPLLITTNLTETQLAAIEPRIASRLAGNLMLTFAGRDLRKAPPTGF